jgi:SAM-dependent methyltransferase
MALASAVLKSVGFDGIFNEFVMDESAQALRILEINEAGDLSKYLEQLPGRILVEYPEVDMKSLPFAPSSFDLVVHSDTLEHVNEPVAGLRECARVLAPGGACCFTVPIVVGRMTRSRRDLPRSYHGADQKSEYLVETEFGSDVWRFVLDAGFVSCTMAGMDGRIGLAIIAWKGVP